MEFSDIPSELLTEHTIPYLDRSSMVRLCLLNKEYNRMCNDPNLWQTLLARDYGVVEKVSNPKLTYMKLYGNDITYDEGKWIPKIGQFATLDVSPDMFDSDSEWGTIEVPVPQFETFIVKSDDPVMIQKIDNYDRLLLGSEQRFLRFHPYMMVWQDEKTGRFVFPGYYEEDYGSDLRERIQKF